MNDISEDQLNSSADAKSVKNLVRLNVMNEKLEMLIQFEKDLGKIGTPDTKNTENPK